MNSPAAFRHLLAALPDRPRWIEARAVLRTGHARVFEDDGGFVVRNDAPGGGLAVVVRAPSAALVREAVTDRAGREVIAPADDADAVRAALAGWSEERAVLHELRDASRLAAPCADVRPLTAEDALDGAPDGLREELDAARRGGVVWTACVDGTPASFAYAYWRTEGWFDVSIDTLEAFRRRGLARVAVSELIRRERAEGREPVWGAMESNAASLQLAASLGFAPTDELVVFTPLER